MTRMPDTVTLADIEAARPRIASLVRETPLWHSALLSDHLGYHLALKCENLQRTGSFKPRGAANMLAALPRPAGVVAASAGNHAQGVALAAATLGIPATVVMPAEAPLAKRLATEGYGAQVLLVDGPFAAAIEYARALAHDRGLLFVPPFDNPYIVAGQGTVGLEILEQDHEVQNVVVPAGGGGLLAGIALAVKSKRPDVRVYGVQTRAMPGIIQSLQQGSPLSLPAVRTVADGAAVAGPSALTLSLIREYVDGVVAVTDEAVAQAIVMLLERTKFVAEGAGALGLAALLSGALTLQGRTTVVLSGGNIDINLLGRIVGRGLLSSGRHRKLTVAAANVPGELARITGVLATTGANIIEVDHDLKTPELPIGVGRLTFELEVAGPEAYDRLVAAMLAAGMHRGTVTDLATSAAAAMPT